MASAATSRVNLPSKSVTVPVVVPLTKIEAPGKAAPVSSITVPVTFSNFSISEVTVLNAVAPWLISGKANTSAVHNNRLSFACRPFVKFFFMNKIVLWIPNKIGILKTRIIHQRIMVLLTYDILQRTNIKLIARLNSKYASVCNLKFTIS